MSDSLRDKIAAVLYRQADLRSTGKLSQSSPFSVDADAVIAALAQDGPRCWKCDKPVADQ